MEEFMMRSDIICPECGSKENSIVGNISPYEYFLANVMIVKMNLKQKLLLKYLIK